MGDGAMSRSKIRELMMGQRPPRRPRPEEPRVRRRTVDAYTGTAVTSNLTSVAAATVR